MNRQIATIARYTLLEAWRTRLPMLALSAVVLLGALAFFVAEIAVIESERMRASFYASGARFAAVFVMALYVLASINREFNDKGFDVVLALDLPRSHYILGKLAGFSVVAVGLALVICLPLVWFSGPPGALWWGLSLAFELVLVVALALFCMITFSHLLPAASFVLAFYLLGRSLGAIRLMSAHPVGGADTASHQLIAWGVESIAMVMPALDEWTKTVWLVDQLPAWPDIAAIGGQAALYLSLLTAATMFDLYRKNF